MNKRTLGFAIALAFAPTASAQLIQGVFTGTFGATAPTVAIPVDTNSGGSCSGSSPTWSCTGTTTVTLTDATAVICYTIDGTTTPAATTPGTCSTGTTYSGTISVASTTTIKAIGTKVGSINSSVLTTTYTVTPPAGTVTFVSGSDGGMSVDTPGTLTDRIPITPTVGNTVVLGIGFFNSAFVPASVTLRNISDVVVQTCTHDGGGRDASTANSVHFYSCVSVPSGVTSLVSADTGSSFSCGVAIELAGVTSGLDTAIVTPSHTAGATWNTGSLSHTSGINAINLGFSYTDSGVVLGTGVSPYTLAFKYNGSVACGMVYQEQASTSSTYTPTGNNGGSVNSSNIGATYK